jgi:hypothetical protein
MSALASSHLAHSHLGRVASWACACDLATAMAWLRFCCVCEFDCRLCSKEAASTSVLSFAHTFFFSFLRLAIRNVWVRGGWLRDGTSAPATTSTLPSVRVATLLALHVVCEGRDGGGDGSTCVVSSTPPFSSQCTVRAAH